MNKQELKKQEAKTNLLANYIKPDTTLLIVIKSVSASGMCRRMRVLVDNHDISYLIADLCDLSINNTGLKITGCGMDMAFWLANQITYNLFGKVEKTNSYNEAGMTGNGGTCLKWVTA